MIVPFPAHVSVATSLIFIPPVAPFTAFTHVLNVPVVVVPFLVLVVEAEHSIAIPSIMHFLALILFVLPDPPVPLLMMVVDAALFVIIPSVPHAEAFTFVIIPLGTDELVDKNSLIKK